MLVGWDQADLDESEREAKHGCNRAVALDYLAQDPVSSKHLFISP